jgi:bifunctional oligoribonuclease and PAP phosphatase NrnA
MKSFTDLERIAQAYKSIIIVPHKHPDGDALGAAFGLQGMLQPFCKGHIKVVGEHTSWSAWMGSFERVADEEWATSLVLVVDTASESLLYHPMATNGAEVILIDHHPPQNSFTTSALIDEQATSTSEILTLLADKASLSLDEKTANVLLYGLLSDTTVLQHPYTSKATMQAVAYLIEEGATYKPLVNRLIKRPFSVTKALQKASETIELTTHGLAYWFLDYHTIAQERFTFNDLFSVLRSIEEAIIIVLVVSLEDQIVLHAQSDHYNLQKVLAPFGGGGHKFASKVRATSMPLMLEVIEALDELLANKSM